MTEIRTALSIISGRITHRNITDMELQSVGFNSWDTPTNEELEDVATYIVADMMERLSDACKHKELNRN